MQREETYLRPHSLFDNLILHQGTVFRERAGKLTQCKVVVWQVGDAVALSDRVKRVASY